MQQYKQHIKKFKYSFTLFIQVHNILTLQLNVLKQLNNSTTPYVQQLNGLPKKC